MAKTFDQSELLKAEKKRHNKTKKALRLTEKALQEVMDRVDGLEAEIERMDAENAGESW